jgi:DNA repair photolyase
VLRDVDILRKMAEFNIVRVAISVTTLDETLARTMEPRTSPPGGRLRAISELSQAGIPVQSMVAPIIPGLNDSEIPAILRAVKDAGALGVGFTLLRLPFAVRPVFLDWLNRTQPSHEERVVSRIKSTRGGRLNDPSFGGRMKGEGAIAEQIRNTFKVFKAKYGLDQTLPPLSTEHFRPPRTSTGQLSLF